MSKLAYIGAGIAKGAQEVGEYRRGAPERDARRAEAQNRQQLSQLKLDEYVAGSGVRQGEQELRVQQLENELFQAQATGLKQQSFASFKAYDGTNNIKHLNNFLKDANASEMGRRLHGDTLRFDEVTRNKNTEAMLQQAGITDVDGFFANPDMSNYVVATKADGALELVDMDQVYAATGYTDYMEDMDLERASKRALNTQRLRSGMTADKSTQLDRLSQIVQAENPELSKFEAYEQAQEMLKPSRKASSTVERLADEVQETNPGISRIDAIEEAYRMQKAGGTERERSAGAQVTSPNDPAVLKQEEMRQEEMRTTDQKKIDEVNTAKEELDTLFEGDFFSSNMSDPKERRKAAKLISRVEQEFPLSPEDRKTITQVAQLTGTGGLASERITDEQAGPIDSIMRTVKSYISNEVKGTAGTAAYEQFRNVLRNAMFGATVSDGERSAFDKAAGTLAQQKGPVLVKLRTQLDDLKTKLNSVYNLNDEYVAKYRLNMGMDELADVIVALDERIDMIDGQSTDDTKVIKPTNAKDFVRGRRNAG